MSILIKTTFKINTQQVYRKLLYIALFFALICNALPSFIDLSYKITDYSTIADELFFIGLWTFCILILYIVKSDPRFSKDKKFIGFFIGLSFWALVKPLFTSPIHTHWTEYAYLFSGLIFLIIEYAYTTINNTSKRH